jgi:hypothetical protein
VPGILTLVIVTYAYIFSSARSSKAHAITFNAERNAPLPNILTDNAVASVHGLVPIIIDAESLD